MSDIQKKLYQIRNEIQQLCILSERSADDVRLIAVSKNQAVEKILKAIECGQTDFGENYVQEAINKIVQISQMSQTSQAPTQWHYIGQLQSNKCKKIAQYFDWVHSVGSLKHAGLLSQHRPPDTKPLQICVQLQLEQKSGRGGLLLNDAEDFFNDFFTQKDKHSNLSLRGLMCVLPDGMRGEEAYTGFSKVNDVLLALKKNHPKLDNLDTLSLGMSADFGEAIKAGSTMLRLGTAIFGTRL